MIRLLSSYPFCLLNVSFTSKDGWRRPILQRAGRHDETDQKKWKQAGQLAAGAVQAAMLAANTAGCFEGSAEGLASPVYTNRETIP